MKITGIAPLSGSTMGGTELVITGVNFSPVKLQNQVMIGNGFCSITSATSTEIRCTTISAVKALNVVGLIIPTNTGTTAEPIVEISVLGRIVEVATCDSAITCIFSYKLSETAQVTSISHAALVSAGETVTAGGAINSIALNTVFSDLTAEIAGENVVLTNDTGGTGFTFVMPVLSYGSYIMKITHSTYGLVENTIALNNSLHITSISPTTGSKSGTRITISGNGFPKDTTKILFGATDVFCEILTLAPDTITCLTPST